MFGHPQRAITTEQCIALVVTCPFFGKFRELPTAAQPIETILFKTEIIVAPRPLGCQFVHSQS